MSYICITSYPHVPLAGVHHDGDAEMSGDADDEDDDGVDYGDVSDDEPLSIFLLLLRKTIQFNCSCFVKLFFFPEQQIIQKCNRKYCGNT